MRSPQNEKRLTKKLKNAAANPEFKPHAQAILYDRRKSLPAEAIGGELTFCGIYERCLCRLQNRRCWSETTCRSYDRIAIEWLLRPLSERPFCELSEYDIFEKWGKICRECTGATYLTTCAVLLRGILEIAYEEGLTNVSLYGMPFEGIIHTETGESAPLYDATEETLQSIETARAERIKRSGTKISRSLPLDTEYRVVQELRKRAETEGEYLAGYLMDICTLRTSEACGLNYGDLTVFRGTDTAVFQMANTSKANSRERELGGKTKNSPRYVYCPKFLHMELMARKKKIMDTLGISETEANKLPICCKGTQYHVRCLQNEAQNACKRVFAECHVEEELLRDAYYAMQEDEELREICEQSAVAYLFRHTAATSLPFCGLDAEQISYCMGHKMEDEHVKRNKFAVIDTFEKLRKKLDRRPIIQKLNGTVGHDMVIAASRGACDVPPYGWIRNDGEQALDLRVLIRGREGSGAMDVIAEDGAEILSKKVFKMPGTLEKTVDMTLEARLIAETLEEGQYGQGKAVVSCANWKERFGGGDGARWMEWNAARKAEETKETRQIWEIEENKETEETKEIKKAIDWVVNNAPEMEEHAAPLPMEEPAEQRTAAKEADRPAWLEVYALTSTGEWMPLPQNAVVSDKVLSGEKIGEIRKASIVKLIAHDLRGQTIAVDTDGKGYLIEPNIHLSEIPDTDPRSHALRHGILLSADELLKKGSVLFGGRQGGIIRYDGQAVVKACRSGRQLVKLDDGDTLAAGCACAPDAPVLLVSNGGKGVCLAPDACRTVKTLGSGFVAGMKLDHGESLIQCLPWTGGRYAAVTTDGNMLYYQRELTQLARNSVGVILVKLQPGSRLQSVVPLDENTCLLLATARGKYLYRSVENVRLRNCAGFGERAIRMAAGNTCVAALAAKCKN